MSRQDVLHDFIPPVFVRDFESVQRGSLPDLTYRLSNSTLVEVRAADMGAFGSKLASRLAPDARRSAGHECDASFESTWNSSRIHIIVPVGANR
jgi:hypothetical protein